MDTVIENKMISGSIKPRANLEVRDMLTIWLAGGKKEEKRRWSKGFEVRIE